MPSDPVAPPAWLTPETERRIVHDALRSGAMIRAGDDVLVVVERRPQRSDRYAVKRAVVEAVLADIGARVGVLEIDRIIEERAGIIGAHVGIAQARLAPGVFAAMRAAKMVVTWSLGLPKYNIDGHTLAYYHGVRFYSLHGIVPDAGPDALAVPIDVLRTIGRVATDTLVAAAARGARFRLTAPWGTDLAFTALPGDVQLLEGGIAPARDGFRETWNHDRTWRPLAGFASLASCDGVAVTMYAATAGGTLSEPLAVEIAKGQAVGVRGGPEAEAVRRAIGGTHQGVHAILMGLNPRYSVFRDDGAYEYRNVGGGAGSVEVTLGGGGLHHYLDRWIELGDNHVTLGFIPKISLFVDGEPFVVDGVPAVLRDPEVVAAAARHGDPDRILRCVDWPERDVLPATRRGAALVPEAR